MGSHLPTTIFAGGYISFRGENREFFGTPGNEHHRTPTQTSREVGRKIMDEKNLATW